MEDHAAEENQDEEEGEEEDEVGPMAIVVSKNQGKQKMRAKIAKSLRSVPIGPLRDDAGKNASGLIQPVR